MQTILVTGATGNVGQEVIKALDRIEGHFKLYAGVRNPEKEGSLLENYNVECVRFDFEAPQDFKALFEQCDYIFLLRPPQITHVKKYFKPLIETAEEAGVKHIVFLSVQGADKSKVIPHRKIENLLTEQSINHTFLRPAYFMQNFTTTLRDDIVHKKTISVPAGKAKFTLVDVADIGRVAATIMTDPLPYSGMAMKLTNYEKLTFQEMAAQLSEELGLPITYRSPNLLSFIIQKKQEGKPFNLILVMFLLHYLQRFQAEPATTSWVETLTHQKPSTFREFIQANIEKFS